MSLNQSAEVGAAGFGGTLPGQFHSTGQPLSRTLKLATNPVIARGDVVVAVKFGADNGKIRTAVAGDTKPFGVAIEDKVLNNNVVRVISQTDIYVNVTADGAIKPGSPVKVAATAGQVVALIPSDTSQADAADELVGYYVKKAVAVTDVDGASVTADAADGDIIVIRLAGGGIG